MERSTHKMLKNKETGRLGEQVTAQYLRKQGFEIITMNYLKKWGEIDVVVKKDNKIHFIEVKTVSYETKLDLELAVTRRTYRPEENVHEFKFKKLTRTIDTWIKEHHWLGGWQIDVAAVRIVPRETFATINMISNIIID